MATFVLIHGVGSSGRVWCQVARRLRAKGNAVYTPSLNGAKHRSYRRDLTKDLDTHITDVVSLLVDESLTDVVLVGHSYAGQVITGVAARVPERLQRLVYLDAYVPVNRQHRAHPAARVRQPANQPAAAGHIGSRGSCPENSSGGTDRERTHGEKARIASTSAPAYRPPSPSAHSKCATLTHTYILCAAGRSASTFAPSAARAGAYGWQVREIRTGHMAMLEAPYALAELLLEIAAE